jgi:hypothetical protein
MMRPCLFVSSVLFLIGCNPVGEPTAPTPSKESKNKPAPDPAVKYYKGPADGKKISIHLQAGFDGSPVTLHYNDVRLHDSDPKTKLTLGLAEIVDFTVGPAPAGKIAIQARNQLVSQTFQWENGTHIGIRWDPPTKAFQWKQSKTAFVYD